MQRGSFCLNVEGFAEKERPPFRLHQGDFGRGGEECVGRAGEYHGRVGRDQVLENAAIGDFVLELPMSISSISFEERDEEITIIVEYVLPFCACNASEKDTMSTASSIGNQ